MYDLYIKKHVREVVFQKDVTLDHALSFLENTIHSMVKCGSEKYFTKEELKNAKSIRSEDRTGGDRFTGFGVSIPEDTSRELPVFDRDNTE